MGYTLLIDNYDSFTWNIYADIAVLGGNPLVRRNDQITLKDMETMFEAGDLDRIIISPGPGHPRTDSGISREVITWGTGKLPILGVCMGLECLVDVLGGEIAYAGEIKHGKTSLVQHDNLGIFHNLPSNLSSTRYHSLSASLLSLPASLQVTATTVESGVIMGVRHRQATVEAVQYHPESCMSEGGRGMMENFLKIKGGYWGGENDWCGVKGSPEGSQSKLANGTGGGDGKVKVNGPSVPSILDKIYAQRQKDVEIAQQDLSTTPENLSTSIALHTAPPLIDFVKRIKATTHTAIMAEIKRASPSKGDIAPTASAPAQALRYALAGASVISVLTEPTWFKGSLRDMLSVRQALDSLPNRPAVLRKDFILSPYQIDEARLFGADTVLLIVAMLSPSLLRELYEYSKYRGIEPLVEVNNPDELQLALNIGAKVIGVNNRNLHDFNVDMGTTSRVQAALKNGSNSGSSSGDGSSADVILCALSGISTPGDVEKYVQEGVKAVLVGEALMRAEDPTSFLRSLIGLPSVHSVERAEVVVKICGVRSVEDAQMVIEEGADLVGIILVPGAKRRVDYETASSISDLIRKTRRDRQIQSRSTSGSRSTPTPPSSNSTSTSQTPNGVRITPTALSNTTFATTSTLPWFTHHSTHLLSRQKPLLVGVFQNQPLDEILHAIDEIGLDIIQLHGDESQSIAKFIPLPVIKCFKVDKSGKINNGLSSGELTRPGLNEFVLLDAAGGGGEGISIPWDKTRDLVVGGESGTGGGVPMPVILAGGLEGGNVRRAIGEVGNGVWGVDVSSGVEVEGKKDRGKVREFVRAAKGS